MPSFVMIMLELVEWRNQLALLVSVRGCYELVRECFIKNSILVTGSEFCFGLLGVLLGIG